MNRMTNERLREISAAFGALIAAICHGFGVIVYLTAVEREIAMKEKDDE